MSDATHVQFNKPPTKAEQRAAAGHTPKPRPKPLKHRIPVLPSLEVDPAQVTRSDQRAVACANMRLAGAPFHEIAKALDYADAHSAKTAFISAMAGMNPIEDIETLRQSEAMRAELLFRKSLAMASADYLVVTEIDEETGEEIQVHVPNTDRLRWHEQAGKDLALHAMITGAKAPARVEVSASTQELNQMVHVLLQAQGGALEIEADVWDADDVPEGPEGMGE